MKELIYQSKKRLQRDLRRERSLENDFHEEEDDERSFAESTKIHDGDDRDRTQSEIARSLQTSPDMFDDLFVVA